MNIQIGDIVIYTDYNNVETKMTVNSINVENDEIECLWFEDTTLKRQIFSSQHNLKKWKT